MKKWNIVKVTKYSSIVYIEHPYSDVTWMKVGVVAFCLQMGSNQPISLETLKKTTWNCQPCKWHFLNFKSPVTKNAKNVWTSHWPVHPLLLLSHSVTHSSTPSPLTADVVYGRFWEFVDSNSIQWSSVITNSVINKHLVITNGILSLIGYFSTQIDPARTNPGHNEQKWPVPSCSL